MKKDIPKYLHTGQDILVKGKTVYTVERPAVAKGWKENEMKRQSPEGFQASGNAVSDTIMTQWIHVVNFLSKYI